MTKTVVALYQDLEIAEGVVRDLVDAGFTRDTISLVANDAQGVYADRYVNNVNTAVDYDGEDVKPGEGAGFGAVVGALVGLGVALIPGIGPVLAVGPLAAALMAGIGAAAGAVTGGVVASLVDFGIPEEEAHVYAESLRRGATLVSVTTDDTASARAEDILNRHHPLDVEERGKFYRNSGWDEFDHEGQPYSANEADHDSTAYHAYHSQTTPTPASTPRVEPINSDYLANVDTPSQTQTQRSRFPNDSSARNSNIGDSVHAGAASNPTVSGAGTGAGDLLSNQPNAPVNSQDWDKDAEDDEGMTPEERERAWVDHPSGTSRTYTKP